MQAHAIASKLFIRTGSDILVDPQSPVIRTANKPSSRDVVGLRSLLVKVDGILNQVA